MHSQIWTRQICRLCTLRHCSGLRGKHARNEKMRSLFVTFLFVLCGWVASWRAISLYHAIFSQGCENIRTDEKAIARKTVSKER